MARKFLEKLIGEKNATGTEQTITEIEAQKREEDAALAAEDRIFKNLRAGVLFEDDEEQSALGKIMPYLCVILQLVTLIIVFVRT